MGGPHVWQLLQMAPHSLATCRPPLQPELAAACTHAVSPLLMNLAETGRNASLCITRKLSYKVIQLYPSLIDALFSVLSHNVWGIVLSIFGLWCLGAWMVWACFSLHRQTHQLISQVIAATGQHPTPACCLVLSSVLALVVPFSKPSAQHTSSDRSASYASTTVLFLSGVLALALPLL